MKVGIISDSHDNLPLIRAAVRTFTEAAVEAIIHAGDIIAPFVAKELLAAGLPVHAVFGNNDGERKHLPEVLENIRQGPRAFELGGKKFLLAHDRTSVSCADLEGIDILVIGHTHEYRVEPGPLLVINPGESGGWITGNPTVAILDTKAMEVVKILLG
jgi:putative phosphoesterase